MWNLRKSRAVLALLAAAALGACDFEEQGVTGVDSPDRLQFAAVDTTLLDDTVRTFVQIERLGNPLAMEVFVAKREHSAHDAFPPFRDPDHFTDDYIGFITQVAGRDEGFARTVASVLLGSSGSNPGDKITVFPNRASGVNFAAARTSSAVGWLTHVLAPGQGYGGRNVINDDVVDKGLGVLFGSVLGPVTAPGLVTDNVGNTNPPVSTAFPYFPAPNMGTPPNTNVLGDFSSNVTQLNGSGVAATAVFKNDNDMFRATVSGTGLTPLQIHAQGIRAGAMCPTSAADADGNGLITQAELERVTRGILLPLDSDLTNQGAGTYPTANSQGVIGYAASASFDAVLNSLRPADDDPFVELGPNENIDFTRRTVVISGAFVANNRIVPAGTEGAVYDPTIPVACGTIMVETP